MLARLSIKNYALIDEIDIQFATGLNIITGETGAGKSIILGALSLILGQRSESKYFYNQDKKCVIEGYFNIDNYQIKPFFEENDLDYEPQTILRREIFSDGKSRAFINDTPVKLSLLKSISELLIAIHSQHATLEINKESFQLLTIDGVAENSDLLARFHKTFTSFNKAKESYNRLVKESAQLKSETDYHQFLFDELLEANLEPDEQKLLEEEVNKLSHAEEIKRSLQQASFALDAQEQSALQLLKEGLSQLQQCERFLPSIHELSARLNSSIIELKDINEEIYQLDNDTFVDGERMLIVQDRLSLIYKLQQKHQVNTVEDLIKLRDELDEKINAVSVNEDNILKLKAKKELLNQQALALADELSQRRQEAIPLIEKEIVSSLTKVEMPQSIFKIKLNALPAEELRSSGKDEVEFLFTANLGQEPQSVSKVASGGELSRLMLAIKSLVAKTSALPTIIFDEIDTGISGEVAIKVGDLMKKLTENLQVIAITHLPQIASQGSSHFKVFKEEKTNHTQTNIQLLNPEERIQEIAQMLGGKDISETAFLHAKELLTLNKN
ncbi:DNA repair protein RecN [Albibacterium bauzanense]|uniref:DNA repair protein RecN n=1 Tax=Albibacterium bauzanense TaxID=653929 RepID=A0A4R1M129_9SPHI|nr:DNA repair protein RecN [Albibacterium bauzanense]TCK83343.1 DNA replication and repair protein RecN [Albibacterium bauzanense]